MEKTLKIAALVCHDNISFELATEQQAICKSFHFFSSFPLICPLAKISPDEKNQNILAQYQNIFQSLSTKPFLQPVEYDSISGIFYRKLQIENCNNLEKAEEFFYKEGIYFGKIILAKANTLPFLFDEFGAATSNINNSGDLPKITNVQIAEKINSQPIELRVFKLAVFSFTLNNCDNFRSVNWQQEKSLWVKHSSR